MNEDDLTGRARQRELAEAIVRFAWQDLPIYDRQLLDNIGASQWQITTQTLGRAADDLLPPSTFRPATARGR
jgi:hypothetical protein